MKRVTAIVALSALLSAGGSVATASAAEAATGNIPCRAGYRLADVTKSIYQDRVVYDAAQKQMVSRRQLVKTVVVAKTCKKVRRWWPF